MRRLREAALRAFIEDALAREGPLEPWFGRLPASGVEILGRGDFQVEDRAAQGETMRQGIAGWLQDDLALFHRPWGCDLAAVTAQTLLLYGVDDVVVPASHADAYRLALGDGQLVKVPGAGHWLRDHEPAVLAWLAAVIEGATAEFGGSGTQEDRASPQDIVG